MEKATSQPFEGHKAYRENQRGVSYETLFGPYLDGVRKVDIVDPYIRQFYQCRNLMELLEVVLSHFDYSVPEVGVHLLTSPDEYPDSKQTYYLDQIADAMKPMGLDFTYDLDESRTIHARHVAINGEWDVMLDRGLDVWQRFDAGDAFSVEAGMPEFRRVKQFEVVYRRLDSRK